MSHGFHGVWIHGYIVICMQDFFETRLLSMDTDFRVLSSTHLGKLPGIDIAQVKIGFPAVCVPVQRLGNAMSHWCMF